MFSGGLKSSLFWVEWLARAEDSIDLMEQFSHDGDDDLLGFLAVGDEPVGEGFEKRIGHSRGHRGHVEGSPEMNGSDLCDRGLCAS